jgi:hypothetical protein
MRIVIFYKNSVNLLIGRRGSGKTFNASYIRVKLGFIPDFGEYAA